MAVTTNYGFPLMDANQSQKEVTYNEAVTDIDTEIKALSDADVALDGRLDTLEALTGVSGTYNVDGAASGTIATITFTDGRVTGVTTRP